MTIFFQICRILFLIFLALFLLGGVVIVVTQAVGLILLQGDIVSGVTKTLAPWVFSAATCCAVTALLLRYHQEG
ncbi:hypothetical protein GP475_08440 [Corynebacterium poyangense]|uniref:Uncharacterized protein n=1 Tax=Corynebacterium poyangense TaxID=2684405 RepID=A0A7H0SQ35_9CORY|nr:hypothetical protein [Corynebacterium poyangense]MBZ8178405.1 hypothetical protein [Corynebacterium poyangense]QNQ90660.1 hypothetical protein GP475_08440 [Corynebacterium poyangense]